MDSARVYALSLSVFFFSLPEVPFFKQSFELNIQRAIMLFTGYNLQDGVPWYMAVLSLSILHVYKA